MRLALPLALFALACGSSRGTSEASVRPEEFCGRFAASSCESDARCAPGTAQAELGTCIANLSAECRASFDAAARPATQGRLRWNAEAAARCLELVAGPCANRELRRTVARDPCAAVWDGAVSPGGACDSVPPPCLGWSACRSSPYVPSLEQCAAGACECGACPDVLAAGAPCGRPEDVLGCAAGTVCTLRGEAQRCTPVARDGEGCGLDRECASGRCSLGRCTSGAAAGEPCEYRRSVSNTAIWISLTVPCRPGLVCLVAGDPTPTADVATGVCSAPRSAGEACRRIRECAPGLTCLSNGSCGAFRSAGDACAAPVAEYDLQTTVFRPPAGPVWTGEGGDCAAGLICVDGRCADRPSHAGDACSGCGWPSWSCPAGPCFGPGLVCDADARCTSRESGSTCASGLVCPTDHYCSCGSIPTTTNCLSGPVGTCEPQRPNGAACVGDGECLSDRCDATLRTCVPWVENGSWCFGDATCVSGYCSPNTERCEVALCSAGSPGS